MEESMNENVNSVRINPSADGKPAGKSKETAKGEMRPKLMLSVSMAIFGTLGLFTRYIPLSSGELALYRAILAAGLIIIYLAVTRQKIDLKSIRRDIPLLLASGVAMGINWILLFQAYRYTTISAATLSYYFAPVIVTIVSPFLFREKLTADCRLYRSIAQQQALFPGHSGRTGFHREPVAELGDQQISGVRGQFA